MMKPTKNTLFLATSGLLVLGFIGCGIFGILNYFIVKVIIVLVFILLGIKVIQQLIENYKKKPSNQ